MKAEMRASFDRSCRIHFSPSHLFCSLSRHAIERTKENHTQKYTNKKKGSLSVKICTLELVTKTKYTGQESIHEVIATLMRNISNDLRKKKKYLPLKIRICFALIKHVQNMLNNKQLQFLMVVLL
jgi:hypothetical protein